MKPQIIIGLYKEGRTDARLLESIIKRTFEDVSFDCRKDLEILNVCHIEVKKSNFIDEVLSAAREGLMKFGIMILCVHSDADSSTDSCVMKNKIEPLLTKIQSCNEACKLIVPVIPVQMSEAWMLADTILLKKELRTKISDDELGINKPPETIANPKQAIEEAIRITRKGISKRKRNQFGIGELYETIGAKISLDSLRQLSSFRKFEDNVRNAFRELKYLN